VRLLSIIFAVLNIPLFYLVGKKLFSRQAAMFGLLFYVFSTYQIYHTTEARTYSLLIFLSLLSTWLFWRMNEKSGFSQWFSYVLISILLAYAHLVGNWLILAQAFFVLIKFWKQKRQLINWLFAYVAVALAVLPYYIFSFFIQKDTVFSSYLFYVPYYSGFFSEILKFFFNFSQSNYFSRAIFALLPVLIFGSFLIIKKVKNDSYDFGIRVRLGAGAIYCLLACSVTIIFCFILHWVTPRYLILASIFCYFLIGFGMENWLGQNKLIKTVAIMLVIFAFVFSYNSFFVISNDWVRVDKCINQLSQRKAKIIVHQFSYDILLKKYYTGSLPFEGFYPINDGLTYEERINKNDARPVVTQENVNKLADYVKGYDQIILVEAIYVPILDPNRKVFRWFLDNNWQLGKNYCSINGIRVFSFIL